MEILFVVLEITVYGFHKTMEDTNCLVEETTKGVIKGVEDIHFAKEEKKGVYYMKSKHGEKIGVYKPKEEEVFRSGDEGKKGDKAYREVAAFLLDHPLMGKEEEGLGRVPPTTMVRVKNLHGDGSWTSGSLQKFIPNQPWWPRSPKGESFSIDDVQRMSLIDIRFGNNDRHHGNILNSNTNVGRLVPIDHGECFPKTVYLYFLSFFVLIQHHPYNQNKITNIHRMKK